MEMETPTGSETAKADVLDPDRIDNSIQPLANSNSQDMKKPEEVEEKFKPGWRLLAAFTSIAIVNLACALDATIISVALPVSLTNSSP